MACLPPRSQARVTAIRQSSGAIRSLARVLVRSVAVGIHRTALRRCISVSRLMSLPPSFIVSPTGPVEIRPTLCLGTYSSTRCSWERSSDLTDPAALRALEVTEEQLCSTDAGACQQIGEAAHHLGREGVRAPSATGAGEVVAVFIERLLPTSGLDIVLNPPYRRHLPDDRCVLSFAV